MSDDDDFVLAIKLKFWAEHLPYVASGDQWEIYAAPRNTAASPAIEPLVGVHGVRRSKLLEAIPVALERANEMLVQQGRQPWSKRSPKIRICVFGVDDPEFGPKDPLTTQMLLPVQDEKGQILMRRIALVALPSRSDEPTWERELAVAVSSVVHEWSHCLNLGSLPLRRHRSKRPDAPAVAELRRRLLESWRWFDEGLAVAAEASFDQLEQARGRTGDTTALPVNGDWLRFALDWVDRPERSLDDPEHRYQAAFFVRYLERAFGGPKFLCETWRDSSAVWADQPSPDACALAVLARQLGQLSPPKMFCSATEADVFGSGYCFDAYFTNDPHTESCAYEPDVHARFRERAVTACLDPEISTQVETQTYAVRGLACRYFRIPAPESPRTLFVHVLPPAGSDGKDFRYLKAELGMAKSENSEHCKCDEHGTAWRLRLGAAGKLECELPGFCRATCDHAVLVVTNCNWSVPEPHLPHAAGYLHESKFMIEVGFARTSGSLETA